MCPISLKFDIYIQVKKLPSRYLTKLRLVPGVRLLPLKLLHSSLEEVNILNYLRRIIPLYLDDRNLEAGI